MHTFELVFDGFRVPASALVGQDEWLNRGFYLQMESFSMGRVQRAGRGRGVMQAALEAALDYARNRIVFGKPALGHQLIRAKIGRMALRLHASRQLGYRAARLLDQARARWRRRWPSCTRPG